jgi:membrane fusion protein, heavy metal efflux system
MNPLRLSRPRNPSNPHATRGGLFRVERTMNTSKTILAWVACIAAGSAHAQPVGTRGSLDCMIQPHQIVQVGAASAGVIESILVDRGDSVKAGQPLVQLRADVERAALAVARERATQEGEITVAAGSAELAQRELQRAKELHEENFVSQTYLDKSKAEARVAGGRTEQAGERRRLAQREVQLAAAQLNQRSITSPIAGVVVERFLSPGEFVDQKPILRVAAIDPLRVDVLVPATAFGQIEPGMKGVVTPELLNTKPHQAVVKTVDRVIDAATNTFRVRLELPNPGHTLPAGLRCKADLGLKLPDASARGAVTPPSEAAAPAKSASTTSASATTASLVTGNPNPVMARR